MTVSLYGENTCCASSRGLSDPQNAILAGRCSRGDREPQRCRTLECAVHISFRKAQQSFRVVSINLNPLQRPKTIACDSGHAPNRTGVRCND